MKATLANVDSDDLIDVQTRLETAYGIKFTGEEAQHIHTFGQLCDAVKTKTAATDTKDCTSQQAFYKLRRILINGFSPDRQAIRPTTDLTLLLSPQNRRFFTRTLEKELGVSLSILTLDIGPQVAFAVLGFAAQLPFFFNPLYGLAGLISWFALFRLASRFGRQFTVQTVGDLVHLLVREHYRAVRHHPDTVNQRELVYLISQLFYTHLALDPDTLTPDAPFVG